MREIKPDNKKYAKQLIVIYNDFIEIDGSGLFQEKICFDDRIAELYSVDSLVWHLSSSQREVDRIFNKMEDYYNER